MGLQAGYIFLRKDHLALVRDESRIRLKTVVLPAPLGPIAPGFHLSGYQNSPSAQPLTRQNVWKDPELQDVHHSILAA